MKSPALIAAAGLLALGGLMLYKRRKEKISEESASKSPLEEAGEAITNAAEQAEDFLEGITLGTFSLSRMRDVTKSDLTNKNVQAFLKVIRRGEGTSDTDGYRRHFGGDLFNSYADHPRRVITKNFAGRKLSSSAAGAYQFLSRTWDETARIMGLKDFSPASQDLGAVGRIAARGALENVKQGRFDLAIRQVAKEWASMPGSPYGQPVIKIELARSIYQANGGVITA